VGYCGKRHSKRVIYNDVLKFNYQVGLSLIENSSVRLSNAEAGFLLCEPDMFLNFLPFVIV